LALFFVILSDSLIICLSGSVNNRRLGNKSHAKNARSRFVVAASLCRGAQPHWRPARRHSAVATACHKETSGPLDLAHRADLEIGDTAGLENCATILGLALFF
jgi:hypothetical protein